MTLPEINMLRDELLLELAKRNANNGSPSSVIELCAELRSDIDWVANNDLARSAGWLLVRHVPRLAKRVVDSERPNALLLALTAQGKSEASRIHLAQQPLGLVEKLASDKVQKVSALFVSYISLGVSIAALVLAFLAYQKS
jgi:hypothetical protein